MPKWECESIILRYYIQPFTEGLADQLKTFHLHCMSEVDCKNGLCMAPQSCNNCQCGIMSESGWQIVFETFLRIH